MHPFIKDNDMVTLCPLKDSPCVGDVVAFEESLSGRLLVHRIIRINGNMYVMKGDDTWGKGDVPVAAPHIVGIVSRVERKGSIVRAGFGPEKRLIALLSRREILGGALYAVSRMLRLMRKAAPEVHQRRVLFSRRSPVDAGRV